VFLTNHIHAADLIITTGCNSGPGISKLISKTQVAGMKAGAVIVDLSSRWRWQLRGHASRRDRAKLAWVDDCPRAERSVAARRGRQRALLEEPVPICSPCS